VVWGDTTTNVLSSTTWSKHYRVTDTTLTTTNRPIMTAVAAVNTILPAGTYWVDWQIGGTLASGPWVPPVTILGQTTTGNSLQYTTTGWAALTDSGTLTPQGLPFIIEGQPAICGKPGRRAVAFRQSGRWDHRPGGQPGGGRELRLHRPCARPVPGHHLRLSNDPDEPIVPVPVTMEVVIPVELMGISIE